jgi:hypothetical protein
MAPWDLNPVTAETNAIGGVRSMSQAWEAQMNLYNEEILPGTSYPAASPPIPNFLDLLVPANPSPLDYPLIP